MPLVCGSGGSSIDPPNVPALTISHDAYRIALDNILPRVEKPVRYVGGEWNVASKDPDKIRTRIALCFPDVPEYG